MTIEHFKTFHAHWKHRISTRTCINHPMPSAGRETLISPWKLLFRQWKFWAKSANKDLYRLQEEWNCYILTLTCISFSKSCKNTNYSPQTWHYLSGYPGCLYNFVYYLQQNLIHTKFGGGPGEPMWCRLTSLPFWAFAINRNAT